MKVIKISFVHDSGHCFVALEPNWIEKIFGAERIFLELVRDDARQKANLGWDHSPWYSKQTNRRLQDLRWGKKILAAMDARPAELPVVRALPRNRTEAPFLASE